MAETRYVKCDGCDNKIYLGSEVRSFDGYCGVYCSAQCFADAYSTLKYLTEDEAENCMCNIWDDNAIEIERAKIQEEIAQLQDKLDRLKE